MDSKSHLAIALDYSDATQALALVDHLGDTCQWYKVGMELYYAEGNRIVRQLRDRGFNVFLDLKLHDIPNTVAGAVRSATQAGASLLTIHASGGAAMMTAAAEAATAPGSPRLLAVTVLTSMDANELAGIGITASAAEQVLRLARLAQASGINGMVCSPKRLPSCEKRPAPVPCWSSPESAPPEAPSETRSASRPPPGPSPTAPPSWSSAAPSRAPQTPQRPPARFYRRSN